jgi:hypothetical protein
MSVGSTSQLLKIFMAQTDDTGGVEEFQLRKQTQLDRIWAWLTQRPAVPVLGSWQHRLLQLFDSPWFSLLVVLLTVLALFLVDVSLLANPHNPEPADTVVQGIIFGCFIFFLLEILGSIAVQNEYFLSFFFLCDLIGTLSLIFDIPMLSDPIGLNFSSSSAAVLRASRVARTGTRATRVLRLLRTIRMPALLRCFKSRDELEMADQAAASANGPVPSPSARSGSSLPDDEAARVRAQQAALAQHAVVNTHVGSKLQLVVSKRVIFMVTVMIFVIPLLTDTDTDKSHRVGIEMLQQSVQLNPTSFAASVSTFISQQDNCIYVRVDDQSFPTITEPDTNNIRPAALSNISSATGQSYALYDGTNRLTSSTWLSFGMTLFTIVLFAGGSVLFTQDAERLFFLPIQRMIRSVKRLAQIVFDISQGSDALALDETILIEAVVARIADLFAVRLERDGVRRKTTTLKTATSRWRIAVEEEVSIPKGELGHVSKCRQYVVHSSLPSSLCIVL